MGIFTLNPSGRQPIYEQLYQSVVKMAALGVFALVTRQSLRVKGRDFFLLVLGETPSFREIAGAAVIIGVVVLSQLLPGKGNGRAGA